MPNVEFSSFSPDSGTTTYDVKDATARSDKQNKTLDTSLTIGGVSRTTVEGALGALATEVGSITGSSIFVGTYSEWDAVVDKTVYREALITDR